MVDSIESVEKASAHKKKPLMPKPSAADSRKGKEVDALRKKKRAPPMRSKGIVIGSPIFEIEEGGSDFARMTLNPYPRVCQGLSALKRRSLF